jgi:hypothetical protein
MKTCGLLLCDTKLPAKAMRTLLKTATTLFVDGPPIGVGQTPKLAGGPPALLQT